MKLRGWVIAGGILSASLAAAAWSAEQGARARPAAAIPEPVVVELFTAQGCVACPDANELVADLADRPGVIVLTYSVDYWDYLGWTDTFARPEFADRQRAYQANLRLRDVYTPQIVVDGRRQVSGARPPEVRAAVDEEAARRVWPPEVEFTSDGERVAVGSGRSPEGGADVWLVRYAPGPEAVEVRDGDNRGQTVRHVNVVREIVRLGDWAGRPRLFEMPEADDAGLSAAVLVQSRTDGRILAAAALGAT